MIIVEKNQHFNNPTFDPQVEAWTKYMKENGDMPVKTPTGEWKKPSEIIFALTHKVQWTDSSEGFGGSQGGKF